MKIVIEQKKEKTNREIAKEAVAKKRDRENALYSIACDIISGVLTDKPKSMYNKDGTLRIL